MIRQQLRLKSDTRLVHSALFYNTTKLANESRHLVTLLTHSRDSLNPKPKQTRAYRREFKNKKPSAVLQPLDELLSPRCFGERVRGAAEKYHSNEVAVGFVLCKLLLLSTLT